MQARTTVYENTRSGNLGISCSIPDLDEFPCLQIPEVSSLEISIDLAPTFLIACVGVQVESLVRHGGQAPIHLLIGLGA